MLHPRLTIVLALLFSTPITSVAQCTGIITGISNLPAGAWQSSDVPQTMHVDLTITTTEGSTTAQVVGCNALLTSSTEVEADALQTGTSVTSTACPDIVLSLPALTSGTTTARFNFPAYASGQPPANTGLPPSLHCSISPASFSAPACAGQQFNYFMCPENLYRFTLCGSDSWNASLTVLDATGGTLYGHISNALPACGSDPSTMQLSFTPPIAQTYRVRILTATCTVEPDSCAALRIDVEPIVAPANDEPEGAFELQASDTCGWTEASFIGATASTGTTPSQPAQCGPPPCSFGSGAFGGRDIWYRIQVPATGAFDVRSANDNGENVAMALYTGAPGALVQLNAPSYCGSCNDDANPGTPLPFLQVSGQAPGTFLYLRIWPYAGNSAHTAIRLCATDRTPPANDTPCGAIQLQLADICTSIDASTESATADPGNVELLPGPSSCTAGGGSDVWYRVDVPPPGLRVRSNFVTLTDLALEVYEQVGGSSCTDAVLQLAACARSALPDEAPEVLALSAVPTTFWIRAYGPAGIGRFGLCAEAIVAPTNDGPCDALLVSPQYGCLPLRYNMLYATITGSGAPGAPNIPASACGGSMEADTWFKVVVPPNGELELQMEASSMTDAALALYSATGSCATNDLQLVPIEGACSVAGSSYDADMPALSSAGLTPGDTVYVRVWRESVDLGDALLCIGRTNEPSGNCTYTLELTDLQGNGWNGNSVTLCIDPPGAPPQTCTTYTVEGEGGSILFGANIGSLITLTYAAPTPGNQGVRVVLRTGSGAPIYTSPTLVSSGSLFAYVVDAGCNEPPDPVSTCTGASWSCGTIDLIVLPSTNAIDDLNGSNQGCLINGEEFGGVWTLLPLCAGEPLAFTLEPNTPEGDVNWALWGPFPSSAFCPLAFEPIRCSRAATAGGTGLMTGATDLSEDLSGDGWLAPVEVTATGIFILYFEGDADIIDFVERTVTSGQLDCWGFCQITALDAVEPSQMTATVHPNPAHSNLTLQPGHHTPYSWQLLDARGSLILNGNHTGQLDLPVDQLPQGLYLLRTHTSTGEVTEHRWVKE